VKSPLRQVLAFAMVSAAVGAAIEVLTGHGTRFAISRLGQDQVQIPVQDQVES